MSKKVYRWVFYCCKCVVVVGHEVIVSHIQDLDISFRGEINRRGKGK